ncbi:stage II sporulation protein M [Acetivibrio cellulolyticus]|uniref:stage II sporulation protein M n=1 Tax=Acetivibrio cellulolyticus TaxID=35830 RepID=UPI0001E2E325|nr:stage II sporulation protein M [Acetivibrio cellulolyticus]
MISKIRFTLTEHLKNNKNTYLFLFLAFVTGVSAGAFTVNGLSPIQRSELTNYFQGFLELFENQKVDSNEILKISLIDNLRLVALLWALGVTIIGIPLIYIFIGVRGFITGFTSGFIIELMGVKGVIFTLFSIVPKEVIIIPCVIALGVNGINFSLNIIRSRSAKRMSKENLKTGFLAYCLATALVSCFIFGGILVESYITPICIRIITLKVF